MSNTVFTGSLVAGPFEQVHTSVYMMTLKLIESSYIQSLVEDPRQVDVLCDYLLSDPTFITQKDLPN